MIRALDHFWQRHLTDLDILREGIGLQAIAQKDPLVEYQRQGFQMFRVVEDTYRQIASRQIFLVQPAVVQTPQRRRQMREFRPEMHMGNSDRPERSKPCARTISARVVTNPAGAAAERNTNTATCVKISFPANSRKPVDAA